MSPGIAVVGEDHRPTRGEDGVELSVGEAVRVLRLRLEAHEIDDVDDADAQVGQVLAQRGRGGEGLERRDVSAAGEDDVGLASSSFEAHSQIPRRGRGG